MLAADRMADDSSHVPVRAQRLHRHLLVAQTAYKVVVVCEQVLMCGQIVAEQILEGTHDSAEYQWVASKRIGQAN